MMPNLIVLDGRLLHRRVSGLERYVSNLTMALSRRGECPDIALTVEWPVQIDPSLTRRCNVIPVHNERQLVESIKAGPPCLYHTTWLGYSAAHYLPMAVAKVGVLTIPDFILWDHPEYSSPDLHAKFQAALQTGVKWAERFLVYSEHTKNQAVERLDLDPELIDVVPLASDDRFSVACDSSLINAFRRRLGARYLLSVGKDYPHKNLKLLVEGYARSGLKTHKLVIVGESVWPGGRAELVELARARNVGDRVEFLDHVLDDELPVIYQGCDAFVYPSLEEGFGLPPLEAMASGVPVVCSNAASLTEVVGDAALLVDGRDIDELAHGMKLVVTDSSMASVLVGRGRERVKSLNWTRSADLTVESYLRASANASAIRHHPGPGRILRYFPSDVPLVSRMLTGQIQKPRTNCLFWIASDPAGQGGGHGLLASLERKVRGDWLRRGLESIDDVDVLIEAELPEHTTLTSAIDFASPSRVIVVGPEMFPTLQVEPKVTQVEQWPADELVQRLRASGWLKAMGSVDHPESQEVFAASAPRLYLTGGESDRPIIAEFAIDPRGPVADPVHWYEALWSIRPTDGESGVLVGDVRAGLDSSWVDEFRRLLRQRSKRIYPIWIASPGSVHTLIESLGEPTFPEWIICSLQSLELSDIRALRDRHANLRLSIDSDVFSSNPSHHDLARLVERAWELAPNATFSDLSAQPLVDPLLQAVREEIAAAVIDSGHENVFNHALRLRRELIEGGRRERQIFEQSLQSHLDGVTSSQEQLDRFAEQFRVLSVTLDGIVDQLAMR